MTELSQDAMYEDTGAEPIAIIGMSARVPGANDLDQFWRNLIDGVESVTFFTDDEQRARGATQAQLDDPMFVKAAPVMIDMEHVDNEFFGMSAREAELADPQQLVFLEQSHAALQDAGYDPGRYDGAIGVYAGSGPTQYRWLNLQNNPELDSEALKLGLSVGNNIDYIATTASYRLNLRGPAMTVTTACSSSLVALHLACEALRNGECDMALAGGVCVELPHGIGYPAMDGFTSSDGHVRPFDARADGTIWGSGVGVLVVKRLEDALADGDHIRAVVLGNAINNDGGNKIGFSAPSQAGQTEVVAEALGVAGVDPRTIGYVEAHGTGTALGDPIEVAALSEAYRRDTDDTGWCGIGSVKSNLGHLSQASGVVGVIKTVLAMEHSVIPPTINYEQPNPEIDFGDSPFYVVSTPSKWDTGEHPRRAAVSSFGIGGTNAHVILQESPPREAASPPSTGGPRPLWLSARTESALQTMRAQLAEFLAGQPGLSLSDVAYTLRAGRADHVHRAAVVAADLADAAAALGDRKRCPTGAASGAPPKVAFLFSGQGAQYAGMGAELYNAEPAFAAAVDECAEILHAELGEDIRPLLFSEGGDDKLRETRLTQPALFTIEYALARLWQEWGARPAAMIGHSVGEYVAATLAGVFALPDALRLVAARGRLMQSLPTGSMLAVTKDEKDITALLTDGVSIATVNGPGTCVVAGTSEAISAFAEHLADQGVKSTLLRTSHAFHSPMMDPILAEFESLVAGVPRRAPNQPFLSNVTGDWITAEQATDPAYWAAHIRRPVRFADCVARLLADGVWALVECGPGKQLAGLARMQMRAALTKGGLPPLPSLPGPAESAGDLSVLYGTAGRLWTAGVPVELPVTGRRVPLPGYPYERKYRFIPPGEGRAPEPKQDTGPRTPEDWFEIPTWRQVAPPDAGEPITRCLAFVAGERGEKLVSAIRAAGGEVIEVRPGEEFSTGYTVRPGLRSDYDALVAALAENGGMPDRVLHAWTLDSEPAGTDLGSLAHAQEHGLFSLLCLVQALTAAQIADGVELDIITAGTEDVLGNDLTRPEHATVAGIARVVPLEVEGLRVRHLDLDPTGTPARTVLAELRRDAPGDVLVLRGGRRWVKEFQQVRLPDADEGSGLRQEGVYLITGGLGGIGLTLAEHLGSRLGARLVLLGRSGNVTPRAAATIARIEQAGGRVTVVSADVTDPVRLRQVRDETLATYGALHGIIHAAGLPGGGMAEIKERAVAQAVLDPKLAGTVALWQAFGDLDLDFVALCSSVTAVSGGFGQVDYCAANAFLDAYARAAHRTRVISINWGAWLEVGMAAAAVQGPGLSAGAATIGVDHPVMRARTETDCSGPLAATTHWVLDEHRIGDVPVLPATGQLECARAAFAATVPSPGDGHAVELRDVVFLEPLAVPDGTTTQLTVAFSDSSSFELRAGGRRHTQGAAAWVRPEPAASTDLAAVKSRLRAITTTQGGEGSSLLAFGPRWRSPELIWTGEDEELAFVEGTEQVAAEVNRWGLHPALLDVATSFGSGRGTGSYLPLSYGRLLVRSALPARFYSHLRRRGDGGGEVVTADLTMLDESGAVLVEIEEFVLRRIDTKAVTGSLAVDGPGQTATGIAPAQGAEAFVRVLAADLGPQISVSAISLGEITRRERLTRESLEAHVPVRQEGFVAPEGELEAALAKVWGEILGVPEVGADDDFFDLGGNSLVAVQLIAHARSVAGVRLPMRTLFEAPSVRQMAAKVEQLRAEQQAQAAPAMTIPRLSRER